MGSNLYGNAFEARGYGNTELLIGYNYDQRVHDGDGIYFENSTLAEASALESEAISKMQEASKPKLLAGEKRHYLRGLKEMLTKKP